MSRSFGSILSSQGAPVSGCRLVLALIAVSIEAVGCQNARSGLSPVATLVCTPCSYGSGTVTTWTVAPVAFWKPSTTFCGMVLLFCAAQMVSLTPSSLAVGSAQVTALSAVAVVEPGSQQPAISRAATATPIQRFISIPSGGECGKYERRTA